MKSIINYICVLAVVFSLGAFDVYAKESKSVTLSVKNKSLPVVLKMIEVQGGKSIVFSYTETEKYLVNASFSEKTEAEAIRIVLENTPFTYVERNSYFAIQNNESVSKNVEIKGAVKDEHNSPLMYCNVVLLNAKDSTFVNSGITGEDGSFLLLADSEGDYLLRASFVGYSTGYKAVNSGANNEIKLKTNARLLKEVQVVESAVIEKPDKFIVIPSKLELDRAANSMSLLGELQLKMPGLRVDELTNRISIDGGSPVLMINGKERPMSRIISINHNDILRIEFSNTPDIRYADRGVSGVINIILKPSHEGGSFFASTNNGLTTRRSNSLLNGSYYSKKSEWNFSYNNTWRKSNKETTTSYEEFIGREDKIIREQYGLPSKTKDFDNGFALDYTYMHNPKTMFVATGSFNYHTNERNVNSLVIEQYGDLRSEYEKKYAYEYSKINSSLDLFFRKQWKDKSTLELNAVGTYSSGDYNRGLDNTNDYSQASETGNSSWNMGGEVMYTRTINKVTTKVGVKYNHGYADNDYTENGNTTITDKLTKDNMYFYGSVVGSVKKLGYSLNIGGKYFRQEDMTDSKSFLRANYSSSLNYPLSKKWSANYFFSYSPSLPSLSNFSNVVQTVDNIIIQVGNMNLKPSEWITNRLLVRFNTGNFYSSLQGKYTNEENPIIYTFSYIADKGSPYYDKFMKHVENGNYNRCVNVETSLGYQNLFNHITLQAVIGWHKYMVRGSDYDMDLSKAYSSLYIRGYWGNWNVSGSITLFPQYGFNGTSIYQSIRSFYMGAGYKWKNWNFNCMLSNPFTKRGFYQKTQDISSVHPVKEEYCIKDFANMVTVSVQYRVNFGKIFEKTTRSLRNGGIDTGVNTRY